MWFRLRLTGNSHTAAVLFSLSTWALVSSASMKRKRFISACNIFRRREVEIFSAGSRAEEGGLEVARKNLGDHTMDEDMIIGALRLVERRGRFV